MRAIIPVFALGMLLSSCGSYLPVNGPSSTDVRSGSLKEDTLPYALVPITQQVIDVVATNAPGLGNLFSDRRPPGSIRFGIGDIVSVTIFEASGGGLFSGDSTARPGNYITLPNQSVDNRGNISVPYAGQISAKGRTPTDVQASIVAALKSRAIEPQVVVSLVDQRTSMISVLGDVNKAERFPASAAGEHILDAITRAGGPKSQGFDTWVMLERAGRRATVPFGALVYEPSNNIYVHPDDTIYLYNEPQTFIAFGAFAGSSTLGTATLAGGATQTQGQYRFDAWRISLTEAIAKAGGLSDANADPASVFLYRGETREVAQKLGMDVSRFSGPIIPIIYWANLREPAGYFLSSKFQMRNKDVIFVSNAGAVETTKFLNQVQLWVNTANDPVINATNWYILRNTANRTVSVVTTR
jgi:polysaccharide export outer membrane protein